MPGTPPLLRYTGGPLATHAYLIPDATGDACLCFDAPEGLAAELRGGNVKVSALLITHGHSDHVADAAAIARDHACPVYIHPLDAPVAGGEAIIRLEVPAEGSAVFSAGGRTFELFHIPGHSEGSVAFYEPEAGRVFAGDVLFADGIGRCKTPERREQLLDGIARHLLPLPDSTAIYPGHGPALVLGDHKDRPAFRRAVARRQTGNFAERAAKSTEGGGGEAPIPAA